MPPVSPNRRPSPEALVVWERWLRSHRRLVDGLDADLRDRAGLPLDHYDVLLQLRLAPGRRLRMSQLAGSLLISRSSCTRLVARLEDRGWVVRDPDDQDGRVVWACLTDDGARVQRRAAPVHLDGIAARFADPLSPADVAALGRALSRLDPPGLA